MQTLYQEQLDEIDTSKNWEMLLKAILEPRPKSRVGIMATYKDRREYGRDYWRTKGKKARAIKRGYGTHYDSRQS